MNARQKQTLEDMFEAYKQRVLRMRSWKDSEKAMSIAEARMLLDEITSEPEDRIELFPGADGDWNWHRKAAGNWEIISRGQGYSSKMACEYGARRANPDFKRSALHYVEVLLPEPEEEPETKRPNVGTDEPLDVTKDLSGEPPEQPYGGVHPVDPNALGAMPTREESNPKGKPKGS